MERGIALPTAEGQERLRVVVGVNRAEIYGSRPGLRLGSGPVPRPSRLRPLCRRLAQVSIGLRPMDTLRDRLRAVRAGDAMRLGTDFPDEVRPLAAEVDFLLAAQEAAIERARSRAADLAHGFKTPLCPGGGREELRSHGEHELAEEVASITDGLRRHVERELARARAGARARGGAPQLVTPIIEQIASVLRRTPTGRRLDWKIAASGVSVRVDPQDMAEMLGNLCENASKWAVRMVWITAAKAEGSVVLRVEDDGPGIPPEHADEALARGGRLDVSRSGSGLGLAIVTDLAEAYGAAVTLKRSALGGLAVELRFPIDQKPAP